MKRLAKVQRTIAKVAGCKISINVLFPRDKTPLHRSQRLVDGVQEESIYVDIPAFLVFELPYAASADFKERQINLTEHSKGQFVHILTKMAKKLQKEDIFYIDEEDKVRLYLDQNDPDKFLVRGKVGDTTVGVRPVVIEGKDDFTEEGVRLMIKNHTSYVDLKYSELMAIIAILKDANLFMYSQELLNSIGFKITLRSDEEEEELNETKSMLDKIEELSTLNRRKKRIDVSKLKSMEELTNETDNENIDDHEDDRD